MWVVTAIRFVQWGKDFLVFAKTLMPLPIIIMVGCLFFITIGLISLIAVENLLQHEYQLRFFPYWPLTLLVSLQKAATTYPIGALCWPL